MMRVVNLAILIALTWMMSNAEVLAEPEAVVSRLGSSSVVQEAAKHAGTPVRSIGDYQSLSRFSRSENRRGDFSRNPQSDRWERDSNSDTGGREAGKEAVESIYDLSAKEQAVDCPCGPDCKCPDKLVCEKGDCKKNYIAFFTASWCKPCRTMYPIIESLRRQGYIIYVFDVDQFPDAARKFQASSVPTMVIMDNGSEVTRFVGVTDEEELKEHIKTRKEQEDANTDYNIL